MINLNLKDVTEHVSIDREGTVKTRFTFTFADGAYGGLWPDGDVLITKTTVQN